MSNMFTHPSRITPLDRKICSGLLIRLQPAPLLKVWLLASGGWLQVAMSTYLALPIHLADRSLMNARATSHRHSRSVTYACAKLLSPRRVTPAMLKGTAMRPSDIDGAPKPPIDCVPRRADLDSEPGKQSTVHHKRGARDVARRGGCKKPHHLRLYSAGVPKRPKRDACA